jgi:transcriptional regulator with XRE-family HTH domain
MKTKKKDAKTLGGRIRLLRGDLTQSEFADILRIKQAMISRYEADKETPSPRVLLRIGQFSNRSIEWLLTGVDTLTPGAAADGQEVKRIAAKATKNMSKEDLVDVAAGYIRDTRMPEAQEFIDMMKELFADKKRLRRMLDYHRYLRFEENAGPRK